MRFCRGILGFVFALLSLGVSWWLEPEAVEPLLRAGVAFNLGAADHPRPTWIPAALLLLAPFALRYGLPLALKGALLLPYAAAALTRGVARPGATFDPARDLPGDSIAPGSPEDVAVNRAIAAALAARGVSAEARPAGSPGPIRAPSPVDQRDAAA